MNSRIARISGSAVGILLAAAVLSACVVLPGAPDEEPDVAGSTPGTTAEADAPSAADPAIVVLADDEVTPFPEFTRSTPAGTWPVGVGLPTGFPAGVPVFPDRWIDDNFQEFESQGRYGYSAMFWGGYDHMEQLRLRLVELGFDVADERDDGKWVIVADSDRYRVVVNGTETARNPGEEDFLDASYTITVVVQH